MRTRYANLSETFDDVLFIDAGDVVRFEQTPEAYDEDQVHPSEEGASIVGTYIAEQLRE